MATATEILARATNSVDMLTVDMDTRVISIPATITILGVESDDDVKRLWFNVPRRYGEFDLSEFIICVNFKNEGAKDDGDSYPVPTEDIKIDDDVITFSWLVNRTAFETKGNVIFNICMKLYDENNIVIKELNTTIASLPVLEGLETERAIVDNNPSVFNSILGRLYAIEAATGNGEHGYYTIAKVVNTDNGYTLTLIDSAGETTATITNGKNGKNGENGKTPQRGIDYWTEDDQEAVKASAESHINSWAPVNLIVTLKPGDNEWVDNKQKVNVKGVTANNIVIISPSPADANYTEYARCGIQCIGQEDNYLTFGCVKKPTISLTANVAVYYTTDSIETSGSFSVTYDGNGNVTIS